MAEDKFYSPEVYPAVPFPDSQEATTQASGGSDDKSIVSPTKVPVSVKFPVKRIALELLSTVLNTQSKKILGDFTFGEIGAISIGKYENGVSGEVKISPNGIVGKNINGTTTFSIDATTGDAVFTGTIQAGAVVSGQVTVTGAFVVTDGTYNLIWLGYLEGGF
jgi:hypothetical protein